MKNLIRKELSLVIPKPSLLFLLAGAMVILPSYPYVVAFFYILISIQITFQFALENKDLEFTAMLPIPRNKIVLARHMSVGILQISQILFIIPFALLSNFIFNPSGNAVGLDANFALFGLVFVYYSIFNIILLPYYFKTGNKMWLGFLVGVCAYFLTAFLIEVVIAIVPTLHNLLDGIGSNGRLVRLIVLIVGIVIYFVTLNISYRHSIKNFEKVCV